MSEFRSPDPSPASKQSPGSDTKLGFAKAQAVVVAVANYACVNSLPEAVLNDARDLVTVLSAADYCGYDPKRIHVLLDGEATLAAIRQALADLAAASREDDTALIFFSGHGERLKDN